MMSIQIYDNDEDHFRLFGKVDLAVPDSTTIVRVSRLQGNVPVGINDRDTLSATLTRLSTGEISELPFRVDTVDGDPVRVDYRNTPIACPPREPAPVPTRIIIRAESSNKSLGIRYSGIQARNVVYLGAPKTRALSCRFERLLGGWIRSRSPQTFPPKRLWEVVCGSQGWAFPGARVLHEG